MCRVYNVSFQSLADVLLLARLMGQYCFAGWCLLSVVVCRRPMSAIGQNQYASVLPG